MESQACTFDLTDDREVVQHIRDLLNLSPLLERGIDEELGLFIKLLSKTGWSSERITQLLTYASSGTRYEKEENCFGNRIVPRNIRERGDQAEWRTLKPRAKR